MYLSSDKKNDKKTHFLKPMRKIQHFLIIAFEFHLKSSSDGTILLSSCDGCDGYEVVIGGWSNSKSIIREEKQSTKYLKRDIIKVCLNRNNQQWT